MVLSRKLFVTAFLISAANLKQCEYAGETEIIRIIYGAHCPFYVYKENEHNEGFTCCAKYGNDTFLMLNQYDCCMPWRLIQALVTTICW